MFRCRACFTTFSQNADLVLHNRNVQCSVLPSNASTGALTNHSSIPTATRQTETLLQKPLIEHPDSALPSQHSAPEEYSNDCAHIDSVLPQATMHGAPDESCNYFDLLTSNYLIDFMEYFLRQCISDADKEASSEQTSKFSLSTYHFA